MLFNWIKTSIKEKIFTGLMLDDVFCLNPRQRFQLTNAKKQGMEKVLTGNRRKSGP